MLTIRSVIDLLEQAAALDEAPLADFGAFGDLDKEGSFRADDLRAFRNPKWREKIINAFKNCPYKLNVYVYNGAEGEAPVAPNGDNVAVRDLDNLNRYRGVTSIQTVARITGTSPPDPANSITVVLVENEGAERLPLTPWLLAHRVCHALLDGGQGDGPMHDQPIEAAVRSVLDVFNKLLNDARITLSKSPTHQVLFTAAKTRYAEILGDTNAAASVLSPMRSARTKSLANPGEWLVETMTQWLVQGRVRFNRPTVDALGPSGADPAAAIPEALRDAARRADSAEEFADATVGPMPREPRTHYVAFDTDGQAVASFGEDRIQKYTDLGYTVREQKPTANALRKYRTTERKRAAAMAQWSEWYTAGMLRSAPPKTTTDFFHTRLGNYETQFDRTINDLFAACVGKCVIL